MANHYEFKSTKQKIISMETLFLGLLSVIYCIINIDVTNLI